MFALSSLSSFAVGDRVINFGVVAEVVEVDVERGLLLREAAHPRRGKWHADPMKCTKEVR